MECWVHCCMCWCIFGGLKSRFVLHVFSLYYLHVVVEPNSACWNAIALNSDDDMSDFLRPSKRSPERATSERRKKNSRKRIFFPTAPADFFPVTMFASFFSSFYTIRNSLQRTTTTATLHLCEEMDFFSKRTFLYCKTFFSDFHDLDRDSRFHQYHMQLRAFINSIFAIL